MRRALFIGSDISGGILLVSMATSACSRGFHARYSHRDFVKMTEGGGERRRKEKKGGGRERERERERERMHALCKLHRW